MNLGGEARGASSHWQKALAASGTQSASAWRQATANSRLLGLAIGISFVAAFSLGMVCGSLSDGVLSDSSLAEPAAAPTSYSQPWVAASDGHPGRVNSDEPGPTVNLVRNEGSDQLGHMTLRMNRQDGSYQEIDVPVYRGGTDEWAMQQQWMEQQAGGIPPHVERLLQRLGYEIRRDLYWQPIDSGQGDQILLPMGQVEITPVSQHAIQ